MGQTLKWWPAQSTNERPRWKEQKNIYNQRDLTKGGRQFGRHQEVLLVDYQKRIRRIHPRTRPEDGLWPSPQLCCWRSYSPRILPDRWRSPHKGPVLKPVSLPNSLYWARWVWVHSHLQWKAPPQIRTLQLAPSVGRTCVLVRTIIEQGKAKPPRGNDDG